MVAESAILEADFSLIHSFWDIKSAVRDTILYTVLYIHVNTDILLCFRHKLCFF